MRARHAQLPPLPTGQIPENRREFVKPFVVPGSKPTVEVLDNRLDAHFGHLPGWFGDRHPNLAGYHVIGDETAKFLAPLIREKFSKPENASCPICGRVAPVPYQESFRREYAAWEPAAVDFLANLRGVVTGIAAGRCFHNGTHGNTGTRSLAGSISTHNGFLISLAMTVSAEANSQKTPFAIASDRGRC